MSEWYGNDSEFPVPARLVAHQATLSWPPYKDAMLFHEERTSESAGGGDWWLSSRVRANFGNYDTSLEFATRQAAGSLARGEASPQ
jgi:hypothetical protein